MQMLPQRGGAVLIDEICHRLPEGSLVLLKLLTGRWRDLVAMYGSGKFEFADASCDSLRRVTVLPWDTMRLLRFARVCVYV